MTPEDAVHVTVTRPHQHANIPALATIEVCPGGGKWKPDLDFLHVGDSFEDTEARVWEITSSRQIQDRHWGAGSADYSYSGTTKLSYAVTYRWRYEAQEDR